MQFFVLKLTLSKYILARNYEDLFSHLSDIRIYNHHVNKSNLIYSL